MSFLSKNKLTFIDNSVRKIINSQTETDAALKIVLETQDVQAAALKDMESRIDNVEKYCAEVERQLIQIHITLALLKEETPDEGTIH